MNIKNKTLINELEEIQNLISSASNNTTSTVALTSISEAIGRIKALKSILKEDGCDKKCYRPFVKLKPPTIE